MGEELLLRDRVEIERRRDEERRLDRISAIERALAVQEAIFEQTLKGAVSDTDLKELERDLESKMRDLIREMTGQFSGMQRDAQLANSQMMDDQRKERERENRQMRNQIILIVLAAAIGIITTMIGAGLNGR